MADQSPRFDSDASRVAEPSLAAELASRPVHVMEIPTDLMRGRARRPHHQEVDRVAQLMLDEPEATSRHQTGFKRFAARYIEVDKSPEEDPELARLETELRRAEMCVLPCRAALVLLCYLDIVRRGTLPPVTDVSSQRQKYQTSTTRFDGEYRRLTDHLIHVIMSGSDSFLGEAKRAPWRPVYKAFEQATADCWAAADAYGKAKGDRSFANDYPRDARTALRWGTEFNARAMVEAVTALRVAVNEKWGSSASDDPAEMHRLAMRDLAVADPPGLVAITSAGTAIAAKIAKRENPIYPSSLRGIYVITDAGEIRLSPALHPALAHAPHFFKKTGNCIAWPLFVVPEVDLQTTTWLCETAIEAGWGKAAVAAMLRKEGVYLDRTSTSTIAFRLAVEAAATTSWQVDLSEPMLEVVERRAGVAR